MQMFVLPGIRLEAIASRLEAIATVYIISLLGAILRGPVMPCQACEACAFHSFPLQLL